MSLTPDEEKREATSTVARYEDGSVSSTSDDPHADLPLKEAIKQYRKLTYYVLGLSTFIILWGYDLAAIGAISSLDPFQRDFGVFDKIEDGEEKWIIPAIWLSMLQAFPSIGQLFAAVAAGPCQDHWGRKKCLILGSAITIFSVLIEFLSNRPASLAGMRSMLLVGKIIQGAALAFIKMVLLTYISEIVPTCLRGAGMALFPAFNLLGQFLGAVTVFGCNSLTDEKGYLIALGLQWLFSLAPFTAAFLIPESPAWLVRKNDMDGARKSLEKLFAPLNDPEVILEKIRVSIEEEDKISKETSYAQCFKGTNLRRTLIAIWANFLPPMFGLPLLTSASYFLQQISMKSRYSLMFLIVGIICGFIANMGSTYTLTHLNRRRLTIWTLGGVTLVWATMGISGCFDNDRIIRWITAGMLMLIIAIAGVGVWPTSYAIMSEVSALTLRAKTQSLGGISAYVTSIFTNFVLPFLYNPDMADLKGKTGFVFAATSAIAAVVTWFIVPEMKGRSPIEIDHMFEEKISARHSTGWVDSSAEARAADM
ncbi:MFS general substrate transporter [Lentithecium fluviatile CBS 122367]|uniref:MFS general substrate transporter n=1 Tax=Lentithecium fluviatile CBS 122367 TaxID=1168545 RepID=A0A6G1JJV7_9PLEO|nr:MFS general substrate transporter [Lentithecium fluviatile CBS 122367]